MNLNYLNIAIAAGVGVVDELMERWDTNTGRAEPFRNATDLARLAEVLGGLGIQMFMPRQARLGEVVSIAGTPLLVKSVSTVVQGSLLPAARGGRKVFVPRTQSAPTPQSVAAGVLDQDEPVHYTGT